MGVPFTMFDLIVLLAVLALMQYVMTSWELLEKLAAETTPEGISRYI